MKRLEQIMTLSHDMKSPTLAVKRLAKGLLEDKEALPEDVASKLELIHDSAVELSEHLKRLDLASDPSSTKREEGPPEQVDIANLAHEVVGQFHKHAEHKNQTLSCITSRVEFPDEYLVLGYSFQLRKALSNLVSNALKYSPPGETVEVWIGRFEDVIFVSVSDNGPGVDESHQKDLFEPFQKAEADPTGDEESTGLGLYVVKKIIDRHGGEIKVESSKGEGSTFTLLLSASSCSPVPSEGFAEGVPSHFSGVLEG